MNIILFGPPGAGKGTQAQNIVEKFNLIQISTGDLLRNEIKNKTDIGMEIEDTISKGDFATDEIIDRLLKNKVTNSDIKNKIIFDGYPRSLSQAKNLDLLLNNSNQKIDFIFFLNVNKETIIKRIEKRKILEKRSDDNLNTILKRYDTYMETTRPVLDFYSKNQNFYEIDGSEEIDVISSKIEQILRV
ncbi:MAG: adenylate kinase [Candidatus Pelagibacter sp. TMED239]|nr:MAG: adenylate kinase [Candidatus Pelagibacter sp. TMED239]